MRFQRALLVTLYILILASMAAIIWLLTPANVPKLLVIAGAWALLIGRIYLEVQFRHSSWGRVLRLSRPQNAGRTQTPRRQEHPPR